ncbi:energy transducer TonB [Gammaproteobacteria bacterium AB-CW1]|uniref:Protein TonB n=1 Tax=Natronospira elongata TaxID=3110268 RepID=A0AAP6MME6_9GAMM|nr:energy transducer TonB [Gammaproteobacteria bacterium AB-CW1]
MSYKTVSLSPLTLLIAAAACVSLSMPLLAEEPDEEEESSQRSESRSGSSTDLGSYRVGRPGSSRLGSSDSRDMEIERPGFDRESMRMDRSDFALEPEFGSGGVELGVDIRPSRDERGDRQVLEQDRQVSEDELESGDLDDRELRPLRVEAPRYPSNAHRNGIEGFVIVRFVVNENGETENVRVMESSPGEVFDRAARRAVERWRFEPRVVDGRPVGTEIQQTIDFTID